MSRAPLIHALERSSHQRLIRARGALFKRLELLMAITAPLPLVASEPFLISLSALFALWWLIAQLEARRERDTLLKVEAHWAARALTCPRDGAVETTLTLHNPTAHTLSELLVAMKGQEGESDPILVSLAPHSTLELAVRLEGRELGEVALWGLTLRWAGLSGVSDLKLERALPLLLKVSHKLIQAPLRPLSYTANTQGEGSAWLKRRDEGELQELRAYQPGDERRRIAWRASARRGALLSKVYEEPLNTKSLIAIDLGAHMMRRAEGGQRPIDDALDAASQALRHAQGEQVGLLLFDQEGLRGLAPSAQPPHRLHELLREALTPRALSLLELREEQLIAALGELLAWLGAPNIYLSDRSVGDHAGSRLADLYHAMSVEAQLASVSAQSARVAQAQLKRAGEGERSAQARRLEWLLACAHELGLRFPHKQSEPWGLSERLLSEVVTQAQRWGCGELLIISNSARLERPQDLYPLRAWRKRGGALTWLEVHPSPSLSSQTSSQASSHIAPLPPPYTSQLTLLRALSKTAQLLQLPASTAPLSVESQHEGAVDVRAPDPLPLDPLAPDPLPLNQPPARFVGERYTTPYV